MNNRKSVRRWLDRYLAAWASNDRAEIEALFSKKTEYRYHPYDEPLIGAAAIAESWLESPDEPGSWTATYRPYVVKGRRAVAQGTTSYSDGRRFFNVFLLRFDSKGRCSSFTEWFIEQP